MILRDVQAVTNTTQTVRWIYGPASGSSDPQILMTCEAVATRMNIITPLIWGAQGVGPAFNSLWGKHICDGHNRCECAAMGQELSRKADKNIDSPSLTCVIGPSVGYLVKRNAQRTNACASAWAGCGSGNDRKDVGLTSGRTDARREHAMRRL